MLIQLFINILTYNGKYQNYHRNKCMNNSAKYIYIVLRNIRNYMYLIFSNDSVYLIF